MVIFGTFMYLFSCRWIRVLHVLEHGPTMTPMTGTAGMLTARSSKHQIRVRRFRVVCQSRGNSERTRRCESARVLNVQQN